MEYIQRMVSMVSRCLTPFRLLRSGRSYEPSSSQQPPVVPAQLLSDRMFNYQPFSLLRSGRSYELSSSQQPPVIPAQLLADSV
jgi:hypothetical protein